MADAKHIDIITDNEEPLSDTSNPEQLIADRGRDAVFIEVIERKASGESAPQSRFETIPEFLQEHATEQQHLRPLLQAISEALREIPTGVKYVLVMEITPEGWHASAHIVAEPGESLNPEEKEETQLEKEKQEREHLKYLREELAAQKEEIEHLYGMGIFHEPDEMEGLSRWMEASFYLAEDMPQHPATLFFGHVPEVPAPEKETPTIYEVFGPRETGTYDFGSHKARAKTPLSDLDLVA